MYFFVCCMIIGTCFGCGKNEQTEAESKASDNTEAVVMTETESSIAAKSLKNWKSVKKITLSKNIKTVHHQSFKNCKSLRTIVVKNTKNIWFSPDTFKGSNTKKMTVKFSKKMSKKTYAKMQKRLRKIGFKGKITRG